LPTKNSPWKTKQSIPHTTETFYDDCVKICEDFAPNFRTGCCFTTKHRFTLAFSAGDIYQKTKCLSSPLTFLYSPAILTELRWTPSQNTAFRTYLKMTEALRTVHTLGRGLLRGGWWPVSPKLVFDQMAALVPENMDGSFYF
jgi:hypothetical protein